MKMKTMFAAATAAGALLAATPALATTIDFTSMTPGPVTSIDGVSFSMSGGPNTATTPVVTGVFGDSTTSLTNSDTNDYPTNANLTATFSGTASNVSFTFNNYGYENGSSYTAYDSAGNVVSKAFIDLSNDFVTPITVAGSGIKTLTWNNGTDGTSSWQFGVGQLSFTAAAVPEPATWAMMIGGIGVAGAAMRRRRGNVRTTLRYA